MLLVTFLAEIIGFALAGLSLWIAAKSLLSDLWKFPFLSELPDRQKTAHVITAAVATPVITASVLLLGYKHLTACVFVTIAIVPAVAWYGLNLWSWRKDPENTRKAALQIAAERSARVGAKAPKLEHWKPWADYVFDVEIARRRDAFEPPPI